MKVFSSGIRGFMGVGGFFKGRVGFTLIEVILSMVMLAIVGSVMFTYFGKADTDSARSVANLGNSLVLNNVFENIVADYKANYMANLAGLQTKIGAEAAVCTSATCGKYGDYTVVDNHFITFDATKPSPVNESAAGAGDPKTLLKVTLKNAGGESLTMVFNQ